MYTTRKYIIVSKNYYISYKFVQITIMALGIIIILYVYICFTYVLK